MLSLQAELMNNNINTVNGLNHGCPIDGCLDWVLGTTTSYTIENTGHSIKVIPSGSNLGTLVIDDKQYCLASLHVHWGEEDITGSEHTMNGVHASFEIHFVHYLCYSGSVYGELAV
eukprot:778855_1